MSNRVTDEHVASIRALHVGCTTDTCAVANLFAHIDDLRREVACLRHYGNKDATAMADEALADGWMP